MSGMTHFGHGVGTTGRSPGCPISAWFIMFIYMGDRPADCIILTLFVRIYFWAGASPAPTILLDRRFCPYALFVLLLFCTKQKDIDLKNRTPAKTLTLDSDRTEIYDRQIIPTS